MYEYLLPLEMLMTTPSEHTNGDTTMEPAGGCKWNDTTIQESCENFQKVLSLMEGTYK